MPRYRKVMLPGARLILSGFYEEDIPLLRARGEELGLTFVSSECASAGAVSSCFSLLSPRKTTIHTLHYDI